MSDTSGGVQQQPKKKKGRSPSYPAIDLDTAILRARVLWGEERQHPTAVETIVKHWGYKSLNGPAALTLAALKKYGLIADEGYGAGRVAHLTDLAADILANPDEAARRRAVQRAALNPGIHKELWEKYGANLPSDANLRWELTRQRGFTETGADEFIPEYRATIAFAQLTGAGTVSTQTPAGETEDDADEEELRQPPLRRQRRRQMSDPNANVLTIPLMGGRNIIVEGEFPITEQDWTQFTAVLNAMKPGLVGEPASGDDESDED